MDFFGLVFKAWQIWILLAIFMFILEIFTPAFVSTCIGIGMIFGGLAALLGFDLPVQFILFILGTVGSFVGVRPFFLKYGYKDSEKIKTNADNLIGKIGKVTEAIDSEKGTGRVAIDGDDWKAESASEEIIPVGSRVQIIGRESIIIQVIKFEHHK